ncbi:MAG TPA: HAMP domain-containing histidine kinase [Flavobacteriales bacterium]|nr:HAMP domain-containing histidine kinase [Flavobacteriales bacterium]
MSRPLLLLVLSGLLALMTWSVREPDADARSEREALRLQEALDQRAVRTEQQTQTLAQELADLGPTKWMQRYAATLELERERSGTLFLGFLNDSLVCWTGHPPASMTAILDDTAAAQRTLPDGIYQYVHANKGSFRLHALTPVWLTPAIENRYLQRSFHRALDTPAELSAQPVQATGPLITDAVGAPLLRLAWRGDALDAGPWIILRLVLLLLSAGALIAACWLFIPTLVADRSPWLSITLFLTFLLALRWSVLSFIPSAPFDRLPLFDPATYAASFAFPSLGDLVINAALIALAVLYIRRALGRHAPIAPSISWIPLLWTGLLASAAWVTDTIIGLVNDSSVDLDLYHVQSLNGSSAAAVSGIALLFIAWALLADTCVKALAKCRPTWLPWAIGAFAVVVSVLAHHHFGVRDTVLFLWPVPIIALLLHIERDRFRFIHAIFGLGVLAALTAHVLTKYTRDREQRERLVLAERISVKEDPVVEVLFRDVAPSLRSDTALHRIITSGKPCAAGALDAAVRRIFFGGFWERYDVRVFAFDVNGVVRCSTDGTSPRSLERPASAFTDHTALADMPDLFFEQGGPDGPYYHARLVVMPSESAQPGQLVIELLPRSATQAMGFPDLLLSGDEPLTRRTERYALARYERGMLVDRSRTRGVPLQWTRELGQDGTLWYTENGTEYLARGSRNGTLITLGLPVPSLLDKATTFSYLFALFSALLALALLVRSIIRSGGVPPMGIGAKVRAALLSFAVIGLIFFGAGANTLLNRQYVERSEASILEKTRSAHAELQQRFDGHPALSSNDARYLEHLLADLSNVLFSDITVYDRHGSLLASSRPQVFSSGLLGPRMDPVAYTRLVNDGVSEFVHQESIGTAQYQSAYMPLRDRRGTVLGYLALPSFADQRQQEQERSGVLVAVVNLFVLLFALSVLVALFISNWTTRPLDLLKRSLSAVDLQGQNTPLPYRGKDELGQLVEVYNRKVEELRLSAERLARSERESAWKEMARQVAHEIKNPLTPMKLNIQHFQHTWDPNAPNARERLDRFSNNLVEQIDVLSRIANEFSHFAQMPPAHPTDLDLAEVADAAVQLFANTPGCPVNLRASGPLPVNADREHLLRTFNNLIKNAQQAIPEDREGKVEVHVHSNGKEAIAEVRDNGSGITADAIDHVFVPRFTTKSSGMGLGLPMVKRMVENAGGRVWFTTEEGKGTSFFIALPLRG